VKHDRIKAVNLPLRTGHRWLSGSLRQGHCISASVLNTGDFEHGSYSTFVDKATSVDALGDPRKGGVTSQAKAMRSLVDVLDNLTGQEASTLIVEDNLHSPTDPAVVGGVVPSAFVGDRVVSWANLETDKTDAVEKALRVSDGYPLNAFVSRKSSSDLGLRNRIELSDAFAENVADSVVAVIVAAYDAESFVVWSPKSA
jgi:hypothetical protein